MKTIKLFILSILAIALTTTSCSKRKGCTNRNAENYDQQAEKDDGSCRCRYVSSVTVTAIPAADGAGDAWDPFSAPDIFVRFAKASSTTWEQTNTDDEASFPSSLILPDGELQFTNESWQFEIVDDDTPDGDDVIYSGTFNPVTSGGTGNVIIAQGGVNITFHYNIRNQ